MTVKFICTISLLLVHVSELGNIISKASFSNLKEGTHTGAPVFLTLPTVVKRNFLLYGWRDTEFY